VSRAACLGLGFRCRRWRRILWEVLDGTAPEGRREALEAHLRSCRSCAGAMDRARALHRTLLAQPLLEPREGFDDQVILRLAAGLGTGPSPAPAPAEFRDPLRAGDDGDPMTGFDWALLWGMIGFSALAIGVALYLILPAIGTAPAAPGGPSEPGIGKVLSWAVQAPASIAGETARDLLRHPLAAPLLLASGLLVVTLGWVRMVLARPAH
jgi:hypothetical protein